MQVGETESRETSERFNLRLSHAYRSWAQVGAYFDGDGSLILGKNRAPFYFEIKLSFSDQSAEQLAMLRAFFVSLNLRVSKICKHSTGAHSIELAHSKSVSLAMKRMMPFTFKKSVELKAGLSYYQDKISGNELQRVLGGEVLAGRRERHKHLTFDSPFLRSEGRRFLLSRRKERALRALIARRKVTPVDVVSIRRIRLQGMSWSKLHTLFPSYSTSTLRRVVSGFHGEADKKLGEMMTRNHRIS